MVYHNFLQKRIFDNANGIHAITREEISDISRLTNNQNIYFVSNGIDLDNFNLAEKNKVFNEKINIGYLGRFGVEKNVKSLILAISKLPINYRMKIKCQLIGPIDKEAEKLKKLVTKLQLDETIIFTGPLYKDEKIKKLATLDFYVHPAYSDVVSIAVMEALASGLPCLISRTSQVSYYYNSNAFLMTEPLVQEIKKGIIEMIQKKEEWEEMSSNSLSLVQNVFNWQSSVNALLKEYELILTK
jgi:glycosyltransferase involved in cell wall biosynthesis